MAVSLQFQPGSAGFGAPPFRQPTSAVTDNQTGLRKPEWHLHLSPPPSRSIQFQPTASICAILLHTQQLEAPPTAILPAMETDSFQIDQRSQPRVAALNHQLLLELSGLDLNLISVILTGLDGLEKFI